MVPFKKCKNPEFTKYAYQLNNSKKTVTPKNQTK